MGYESKMYIVHACKEFEYAEIIASFDLCCCPLDGLFTKDATKKIYILESNSNDKTIKVDAYGDTIKEEHPQKVINALRKIDYWRAQVFADLIKDILIECNTRNIDEIMIYHYGH